MVVSDVALHPLAVILSARLVVSTPLAHSLAQIGEGTNCHDSDGHGW